MATCLATDGTNLLELLSLLDSLASLGMTL